MKRHKDKQTKNKLKPETTTDTDPQELQIRELSVEVLH